MRRYDSSFMVFALLSTIGCHQPKTATGTLVVVDRDGEVVDRATVSDSPASLLYLDEEELLWKLDYLGQLEPIAGVTAFYPTPDCSGDFVGIGEQRPPMRGITLQIVGQLYTRVEDDAVRCEPIGGICAEGAPGACHVLSPECQHVAPCTATVLRQVAGLPQLRYEPPFHVEWARLADGAP